MKTKSIKRKLSTAVWVICMTGLLAGCQNPVEAPKKAGDAKSAEAEASEDVFSTVEATIDGGSGTAVDDSAANEDHYKKDASDGHASAEKLAEKTAEQPAENQTQEENHPQEKIDQDHQEHREPPEGFELTLASEDWGLSFGEPGAQPVGNATAQDLAWYDAYYVGDDSGKVIYLTFDCGYENGNTEPILDALKRHRVEATFFVVGHFLETAPDLVKRMVEDGHAVGNHTYHHLDMPTISDRTTFQKEIDDVAELFYEVTGTELAPYYRPPQGKCNVDNLKMAQEAGYHTIFWSLAYVDWNQDDQPSRKEALDKLTARVHPGAVVLLHNTSRTNGEILDELLTKWEEMGYTFRPLSELVMNN